MNDSGKRSGASDAIIDVILPFAESSDARLRGNAMHALAALVCKSEQIVAKQAEEQLLETITSDLGSTGTEGQRRFMQRALDALGRLPNDVRLRLAGRANERLRNSTEPSERARIAGFLVAGSAAGRSLPPLSWMQMVRLTFEAGRPSVGKTIWAASARVVIAALIFGFALNGLPGLQLSGGNLVGRLIDIAIITAIGLSILACLSLAGRTEPSRQARQIDIAISAVVFLVLAGLGTALMLKTGASSDGPIFHTSFAALSRVPPVAIIQSCLIGFVLGAAVRFLRWAAEFYVIEPEGFKTVVRPAAAACVATLACGVSAKAGMDATAAGALWIILAPVASVAASLDVWLERQIPQSLSPPQKRSYLPQTLPTLVILSVIALGKMFYDNVNKAIPTSDVLARTAVSFPVDPLQTGSTTVETSLGVPVRFTIEQRGRYGLITEAPGDTVLRIISQKTAFRREVDDPDPPKYIGTLGPDTYYACVVPFPSGTLCGRLSAGFDQLNLIESAALLIGGRPLASEPEPAEPPQESSRVKITLTTDPK
jgi:hypothetical protein